MADPERLHINIDGASRGNPGMAGIGIIIRDGGGRILKTHGEFIGRRTNNEAEYAALKRALELAQRYTKKNITIYSDSELLVRQRTGKYRTRRKNLKPLAKEVDALQALFEKVDYESIPREENREADRLANRAIDAALRAGRR